MLAAPCFAQEQAIIQILDPTHTLAIGRGVIVSRGDDGVGVAITAAHVVVDAPATFKIRYRSGFVVKNCSVIRIDQVRDLAAIRVYIPEGIEPISIVEDIVGEGFVYDLDWNKKDIRLLLTQKNHTFYQFEPRPGESGGPIFSNDNKLIGVVSGGWFFLEKDEKPHRTWPLRSGRLSEIRNLFK